MKKVLVIYTSKYGTTKTYIEMLKKDIPCDAINVADFKKGIEEDYDIIILAGSIYAGNMAVVKKMKKYLDALSDKKITIFAVGLSEYTSETLQQIQNQNLKDISHNIPLFYGRGIYDEMKMSFVDKALCKAIKKSLKNKNIDSLDPTMKALLSIQSQKEDYISEDYLKPIINFIKSI